MLATCALERFILVQSLRFFSLKVMVNKNVFVVLVPSHKCSSTRVAMFVAVLVQSSPFLCFFFL